MLLTELLHRAGQRSFELLALSISNKKYSPARQTTGRSCSDFPGVDHEGRQARTEMLLLLQRIFMLLSPDRVKR